MSYCIILFLFLLFHRPTLSSFFFFNDTATTEIYTLSLHDALPISSTRDASSIPSIAIRATWCFSPRRNCSRRSEEHTSELQSHLNLVCRLLLEKKKIEKHLKITISQ